MSDARKVAYCQIGLDLPSYFNLKRGQGYKMATTTITSEIENVDLDELAQEMPLKKYSRYDVRFMEQGLLNITNKLGTLGYSFVNVTPNVITTSDTGITDVEINIGASRKNYIERIEIVDNNRTMDRVIRRELQLIEVDAFNQLKLDEFIKRVRNLGFFSRVDVANFRGSTDALAKL